LHGGDVVAQAVLDGLGRDLGRSVGPGLGGGRGRGRRRGRFVRRASSAEEGRQTEGAEEGRQPARERHNTSLEQKKTAAGPPYRPAGHAARDNRVRATRAL